MSTLQPQTRQRSGGRRGTIVLSVLAVGFASTSPCTGGDQLTKKEAAALISAHQGSVENSRALFPESVSEVLPMNSMGPRMVSKTCRGAWQKAYETLVEKGYLSSFEEKGPQIGIREDAVTARGKQVFSRLTSQSFYCSVAIISAPSEADVRVLQARQEPGANEALAVFEASASEAFSILWKNKIFEAACGGEIGEGLIVDNATVRGHAHFKFRRGRWQVEKVELGPYSSRE